MEEFDGSHGSDTHSKKMVIAGIAAVVVVCGVVAVVGFLWTPNRTRSEPANATAKAAAPAPDAASAPAVAAIGKLPELRWGTQVVVAAAPPQTTQVFGCSGGSGAGALVATKAHGGAIATFKNGTATKWKALPDGASGPFRCAASTDGNQVVVIGRGDDKRAKWLSWNLSGGRWANIEGFSYDNLAVAYAKNEVVIAGGLADQPLWTTSYDWDKNAFAPGTNRGGNITEFITGVSTDTQAQFYVAGGSRKVYGVNNDAGVWTGWQDFGGLVGKSFAGAASPTGALLMGAQADAAGYAWYQFSKSEPTKSIRLDTPFASAPIPVLNTGDPEMGMLLFADGNGTRGVAVNLKKGSVSKSEVVDTTQAVVAVLSGPGTTNGAIFRKADGEFVVRWGQNSSAITASTATPVERDTASQKPKKKK